MEGKMTNIFWYPGYDLPLKNIVRAENCNLYDAEGKRYVDLESGVWCTSIGHGNPRILRVITEQAALITHTGFSYSNKILPETAQEILSLIGFEGGKCVFLCSGSEAVEFGVRVAQSINTQPLLMTLSDSYFGAYGSASRKQEDEWFCFDWMACAGCHQTNACNEQCEHWAKIPFDKIGGFLFEPGSSSGFVRFPPENLIQSIVSKIRENHGLVLINEVTTGVGRTGKWFGYQHYNISPDIVAMGKGIGNGYPVSVTAFSPHLINKLGDKPVKYAQSHQNDPLGAAIIREVIQTIKDDNLIDQCNIKSALLVSGLDDIKVRTHKIKVIRARGLMIAIEMEDDEEASYTTYVQKELLKYGYVIAKRPGLNILRIDPSLTIESNEIRNLLKIFEKVLTENYV
jgi:4-aminobutyrate aminotransferase-like enzyme